MTLADVEVFTVPAAIVHDTERALRRAGDHGYELFVLWSGHINNTTFEVRTAHVPHQSSYQLAEGLLVRVEGEALHKLNAWLYDNGEALGVQIHAHPTDAYHSTTDSAYPIVTTLGGLSIVAANFCAGELLDKHSATYRLTAAGWRRLRRRQLPRTIEIVA